MARKTTTHFDDTNGKDLVYGIVLTEALNVLSQDKRRSQSLVDDYLRQDRLLDIKNLLDDIFLAGISGIPMSIACGFIRKLWWRNLFLMS